MSKVNPIELQKYLKGVDYPTNKKQLLSKAKKNGANKEILSFIEELSEEEFETPAEVSKAAGQS
jgi:hypothetical protein